MGIYENYSKGPVSTDPETGLQTWTEYQEWPGYKNSRTVTATPWVLAERTDCYCCSCDDERPGSDPACRNHTVHKLDSVDGVHTCTGCLWAVFTYSDKQFPALTADAVNKAFAKHIERAQEATA